MLPSVSDARVLTKLRIVIGLAVAAMIAVAAVCLVWKKAATLEEKELATKHVVETAYSIVSSYQRSAATGEMSEPQAQKAALAALRAVRYGDQDYVWVNDMHPTIIMHPTKPELDGKDASDMKDPDGIPPSRTPRTMCG